MSAQLLLSPEIVEQIIDNYAATGSLRLAASAVGVDRRSIYRWMRLADSGNTIAVDLVRRFEKARAIRLRHHHDSIGRSAEWKAHAWVIERSEKPSPIVDASPSREAWNELNDEEAVDAVSQDPRVVEAVRRRLEAEAAARAALPPEQVEVLDNMPEPTGQPPAEGDDGRW